MSERLTQTASSSRKPGVRRALDPVDAAHPRCRGGRQARFLEIRTQGPRSMGYGSGVGGMTMEAEDLLPSTPDARRDDCTSY